MSAALYAPTIARAGVRGSSLDLAGESVTHEYAAAVGITMLAGRWLSPEDDGQREPVAVISERLWAGRFSRDSSTIGEHIDVDGRRSVVIGIVAASFRGLSIDNDTDLWLPLGSTGPASARGLNIIGRLGPGESIARVQAEVRARWPTVLRESIESVPKAAQANFLRQTPTVQSLENGFSQTRTEFAPAVTILLALTALLLVIAVTHVAGLLFIKQLDARRDIATRLLLGSGRWRLIRPALLEAFVLAGASLAIALPLVHWTTNFITTELSVTRTLGLERALTPDWQGYALAMAIAGAASAVVTLAPVWRVMRLSTGRQFTDVDGTRVVKVSGSTLMIVQVAASTVFCIAAGMFGNTLARLERTMLDYRGQPVLFTRLWREPSDRRPITGDQRFEMLQELAALPGVTTAAMSNYFPSFAGLRVPVPTEAFTALADGGASVTALVDMVSPDFFAVYGISILRGRDFGWSDNAEAPNVAIVSLSVAQQLFPDGALGRSISASTGSSAPLEIVGVVEDSTMGSAHEGPRPVVFRPLLQTMSRAPTPLAHVRVAGDMGAVRAGYQQVIERERRYYARGLFTFDEWIDSAFLQERMLTTAASLTMLLAIALTAVGLYVSLAYSVAARMREIGLRIALGATRPRVMREVAGRALAVVLGGVTLGIPLGVVVNVWLRSRLVGITDHDVAAMAPGLFVLGVCICAALVPAWHASRLTPAAALKED